MKKRIDIGDIAAEAMLYKNKIDKVKHDLNPDFPWYPYGTLNSFHIINQMLQGENRFILDLIADGVTVDIGCADGDTAFFLESMGCKVQVIDLPPTNFNGMKGVRLLKEELSSLVEINEIDLDSQFNLPEKRYKLVFFMGILYHLKNPFYVLESLAKASQYCIISTRVFKFNKAVDTPASDGRIALENTPVAYLLDDFESNNDPTNFWIFSDAGLKRLFKRTGWEIVDYITVGDTTNSDPYSQSGDERAFCLVKSKCF